MLTYERPGVYTSWEVNSLLGSGTAARLVGVAAEAGSGAAGECVTVTSYSGAVGAFGAGSAMAAMLKTLFENGAASAIGVAVENADYASAFAALAANEDVSFIVCDSSALGVQQAMLAAIASADEKNKHKLGVVELDGTVAALTARAAALNSERMLLAAPALLDTGGGAARTGLLSAAAAAVIAAENDPAIPLNGAVIRGFGGLGTQYGDGDINTLVRGGVTPLETVGGAISIVRGISTRTTTGGVADATWREINTVLIVDDVIPAIRNSLRARFSRTKNTAQTRDAIRSQVIMELEAKLSGGIIDSYGAVAVSQDGAEPTLCIVEFEFAVAHGLNQIMLSAHITV